MFSMKLLDEGRKSLGLKGAGGKGDGEFKALSAIAQIQSIVKFPILWAYALFSEGIL
jgi:hypothetical protein